MIEFAVDYAHKVWCMLVWLQSFLLYSIHWSLSIWVAWF